MTDDDILTIAERHNVLDKFDVHPTAQDILAFARDLAGAVMAERDAPAPLSPPGLDWRERPRAVEPPSPMSDSDLAPL